MSEKKLLDAKQVASVLGVSKATTYELIRRGQLPCVRVGKGIRIHPDNLERWLQLGGTRRPDGDQD